MPGWNSNFRDDFHLNLPFSCTQFNLEWILVLHEYYLADIPIILKSANRKCNEVSRDINYICKGSPVESGKNTDRGGRSRFKNPENNNFSFSFSANIFDKQMSKTFSFRVRILLDKGLLFSFSDLVVFGQFYDLILK